MKTISKSSNLHFEIKNYLT